MRRCAGPAASAATRERAGAMCGGRGGGSAARRWRSRRRRGRCNVARARSDRSRREGRMRVVLIEKYADGLLDLSLRTSAHHDVSYYCGSHTAEHPTGRGLVEVVPDWHGPAARARWRRPLPPPARAAVPLAAAAASASARLALAVARQVCGPAWHAPIRCATDTAPPGADAASGVRRNELTNY